MTPGTTAPTINAVVFDIGETVRDDTREFARWADWIGVPRHTFSAVMGALKATGRPTNDVFSVLRPGFDLALERQRRTQAGLGESFDEEDLYPDVRSTCLALKAAGLWVGLAGNQTVTAAALLRRLGLAVDAIATSDEWSVSKPDAGFFDRLAAIVPVPRMETLYVGDHRDHDIVAAARAGFHTTFVRRGPWGYLWANDPIIAETAVWSIDSLSQLPKLLRPRGQQA